MRETLRKVLSLILAVSMVMSMSTAAVLAADGEEEPTCGLTQHTHTEACYEERETLTCTLTEGEGHTHDDSCYGKELTCSETEGEGHAHGDGCYTVEKVLTCAEDHDHTEDCYTQEETLTCSEEETQGHTHDDSCYGEPSLTCSETETEGHTHDETCYGVEKVLVCGLEEHTHSVECRKAPEFPVLSGSSGAQTVPEVVEAPGLTEEQPAAVEPQPECTCETRCGKNTVSHDCPVCYGTNGDGDVSRCAAPAPRAAKELSLLSVTMASNAVGDDALTLSDGGTMTMLEGRAMSLRIDIDCPGDNKSFVVSAKTGAKISISAEDGERMSKYIASSEMKSLPRLGDAKDGWSLAKTGDLHITYTPDTVRAVLYLTVEMDAGLWDRQVGTTLSQAIRIWTTEDGEDKELFSQDMADGRTASVKRFSLVGGGGAVAVEAGKTFSIWDVRINGSPSFFEEAEIVFPIPKNQAGEYATFVGLDSWGGGYNFYHPAEDRPYTVADYEKGTLTLHIKNASTWSVRVVWPTFKWDTEQEMSTPIYGGQWTIRAKTPVGGWVEYTQTANNARFENPEDIVIYYSGQGETRYNWYEENPDLIYPAGGILMGNREIQQTPKHLSFTYPETEKFGVVRQDFGQTATSIRYQTTADPGVWHTYDKETGTLTIEGLFPDDPEGKYFTAIECVLPGGVPRANISMNSYVKLLAGRTDGEGIFSNRQVYSLIMSNYDMETKELGKVWGKNGVLTRYLSTTDDVDKSTPRIRQGSQNLTIVAGQKAGRFSADDNYTSVVAACSMYLHQPIFYVRLPQEVSIENLKLSMLHSDKKGEDVLTPDQYTVERGPVGEDGFSVYTITPLPGVLWLGGYNGRYAIDGWRIAFDVRAEETATAQVIPWNEILFIRNANGGADANSSGDGEYRTADKFDIDGDGNTAELISTAKSGTYLTIQAANDKLAFTGGAVESDICAYDSADKTAYISGDGDVTFHFTVKNPQLKAMAQDIMKNFYFYIPVPDGGDTGLELTLKDVTATQTDTKLALDYTSDPTPSGNGNWSDSVAGAKWVRVRVPESAMSSGEAAGFDMTIHIDGATPALLGKTFAMDCDGVLVSLDQDSSNGDKLALKIEMATGTVAGRVYVAEGDGSTTALPNVEVTAVATDNPKDTRTVKTDGNGDYHIGDLRADTVYILSLTNPGDDTVPSKTLTYAAESVFKSTDNKAGTTQVTAEVKGVTGVDGVFQRKYSTLRYDLNGGVGAQGADYSDNTVLTGTQVTVAADPVREGWKFLGWTVEGKAHTDKTFALTYDMTLVAQWTPKLTPVVPTFSVYQVEYYLEQLDGTYACKHTTGFIPAKIGDTVTAPEKTFAHYTLDETVEGTVSSGVVFQAQAGDNNEPEYLVLKLYYKLDTVTLTVKYVDESGKDLHEKKEVKDLKYGSRQTEEAVTISGYQLVGEETQTAVMEGDQELTFVYKVKPADRPSNPDPAPDDDDDDDTPDPKPDPEKPAPDPAPKEEPEEDLEEGPVPLAQPEDLEESLEEDLEEVSVPLAQPEDEMEEDLDEEPVPLADVPKTGDDLLLWLVLSAASAAGLVWLTLSGRKREED